MKKRLLLFVMPAILVISCGDSFTSLAPISSRNVKNFYKTETDFKTAINGVYNALQANGTYNNNYILLLEMRADNTANGGGATGLAKAFERIDQFNMLNTSNVVLDAWSASYKGIASANKVLAELDKDPNIGSSLADRIRGEALFIRSLLYYNLAVIFGNIPLVLDPPETYLEPEINQVDASTIYSQIAGDLATAVELLPPEYPAELTGRATSGAAATLLGKVYLTVGQNSDAEAALRQVLGKYELVDDYNNLWGPSNEGNPETIFAVQFKSGGLGEGSRFTDIYTPLGSAPGVGGGNAPQALTDEIIEDVFDQNDDERFSATFELDDLGNYYVEKFASNPFGPFDADNDWIVLRYADVLLMLAEAIGESPEAYGYINEVRNRAGLNDIGPATPGTFKENLLEERRREFAFENKRWPDLKRFGVAKEVMSQQLTLPESRIHLLYPIPQQEISVTDGLQQNPAYR